ncbi:hypothetical protein RchiOBHm_Chr5g0066261 [Rosa chinensis]|uniref:Uncharacterized protein n=1 Tax=Rosa chinensis TaxID=74649 RepID=A0A2P6QJ62_ROSCH|nr:hypothetical protein RchiOBHm_Chr5g0066261 [Rosa chinensis]
MEVGYDEFGSPRITAGSQTSVGVSVPDLVFAKANVGDWVADWRTDPGQNALGMMAARFDIGVGAEWGEDRWQNWGELGCMVVCLLSVLFRLESDPCATSDGGSAGEVLRRVVSGGGGRAIFSLRVCPRWVDWPWYWAARALSWAWPVVLLFFFNFCLGLHFLF